MTTTDHSQPMQLGFERLAVLAVSRMATVELCRITQGEPNGAVVAVKRLPPDYSEDPDLNAMFRDEIWMASALRHPNVARVLGWGEDRDGPYLVVEFVRGVSLSRLMRTVFTTGEAFSERLIVFLATSLCAGLAAAHNLRTDKGEFLNLVHRDLTPGNILLSFDGEVKISDFGLAKAKRRLTQTAIGVTKGEPAYMSPEQVCGQQLDGRSDIFAVGVLLYELFAQRRPWTVTSVKDALSFIVEGEAPDLGASCPRIDRALIELVNRCLAKKKGDRFQSATELQAQLDKWLHLHGYTDSREHLARFVRRNAMRQMRWVDRALAGEGLDDSPSPLELSQDHPAVLKEPPGLDQLKPKPAKQAKEQTGAGSISRHGSEPPPDIKPPSKVKPPAMVEPAVLDQVTSDVEEPEATTMRRERASTLTVTVTPRSRDRDSAPPLGATGQHSVLDVRDPEADEPSTLRRAAPSRREMRDVASDIAKAARMLGDQARASAEIARRAADHADAARDAAARAAQAAEAVKLAGSAMDRLANGDDGGALDHLLRAKAMHNAAVGDE